MLIRQATINLSANVLSALLGLLSVFVFTRLFSAHDYGIYLLGVGFASVISVAFIGWFRNLILSEHAKNDGTDIRGLVISGYLVACLSAPLAYGLGRLVGLDAWAAAAAVGLAIAVGLFELTQDLVRARLLAMTAMKATLVRALSVLCLGVVFTLIDRTGFLLLASSALAYLLATWVQARALARHRRQIRRPGLAGRCKAGLAADDIADAARHLQRDRPVHDRQSGRRRGCRKVYRRPRPGPADPDDAGDQRRRRVLSAGRPDPSPIRGKPPLRSHLGECAELLFSITLPACLGFAVIAPHIANVVLGVDFRETAARDHAHHRGRGGVPGPDTAVSACELPAVGPQLILPDQHGLDHRGQCDPVGRPDQQIQRRWRGVGAARRGCLRLRLRPDPQPPRISDPDSAWPAGTDDDRRTDDGAAGRSARPLSCMCRTWPHASSWLSQGLPVTPRCAGRSTSPGFARVRRMA